MNTDSQRKISLQEIRAFTRTAADELICFYLLLMLAVFPLYSQEGYAHIGTDKAYFFCRVNICAGCVFAVIMGIRIIAESAAFLRRKRRRQTEEKGTGKKRCARALGREKRKRLITADFTSTDFLALLYAGALLVSYACSAYRENAFWGARGWYMGLVPQLMLTAIYFLISRLWRPRKWMIPPMLAVSAAVFLLGCLNRFGIYPIKMQYSSPTFISTVGNINWFCGYAVTTGLFGAGLRWLKEELKPVQKVFLTLHAAAGFTALVLQGSESGLAALAVIFLVMFLLSVEDERRMSVFWKEMILFGCCCLLIFAVRLSAPGRMNYIDAVSGALTFGWLPTIMTIVSVSALALTERSRRKGRFPKKGFRRAAVLAAGGCIAAIVLFFVLALVNTARPGSIGLFSKYGIFTLDEKWGSSRGITWSVGWKCFAEQDFLHKMTGVGPDCMPEYLYGDASPDLQATVKERFDYARLTNAHNEWLTVLVNTGLLGAVSFAGMMVSGIWRLLRRGGKNPLAAACGLCLLGYTINNIFSFQQAMSVGTAFVIFGMGTAFLRAEQT